MLIKRWLGVCLALVPLALNSVILVGFLDADCTYTIPDECLCAVEEIQCGKQTGYNEGKECADRKNRDNTETNWFGCTSAPESYTDCVVDPDSTTNCYTQWDCYVKSRGVCGYDLDEGYLVPVNTMKSVSC